MTTASGVAEVVRGLAVELFPEPPFEGDDPLAEHDWDSLDLEQLIALIEERFLILLNPEDTARANFCDVPTLAGVVLRRLEEWDDQGPTEG